MSSTTPSVADFDWNRREGLGSGAFGKVYKVAWLKRDGKPVALKVSNTSRDSERTFRNEIEVFKRMGSNLRIVEFYGAFLGVHKGRDFKSPVYYIIMEYCPYGTLMDIVRKEKEPFALKSVQYIMTQVITAITFMHEKGIVHRDLSPKNILVKSYNAKGPEIKLCDFGLSSIVSKHPLQSVCGTPGFYKEDNMKKGYKYEADFYSMGCLCYFLLTMDMLVVESNQIPLNDLEAKTEDIPYATEFILMLTSPQNDRLTFNDINAHDFFSHRRSVSLGRKDRQRSVSRSITSRLDDKYRSERSPPRERQSRASTFMRDILNDPAKMDFPGDTLRRDILTDRRSPPRRSPPPRDYLAEQRSPPRRSPPRRSPPRRDILTNQRSPSRRSPPRRDTLDDRRSPPRRSPPRRSSAQISPPRRRSPSRSSARSPPKSPPKPQNRYEYQRPSSSAAMMQPSAASAPSRFHMQRQSTRSASLFSTPQNGDQNIPPSTASQPRTISWPFPNIKFSNRGYIIHGSGRINFEYKSQRVIFEPFEEHDGVKTCKRAYIVEEVSKPTQRLAIYDYADRLGFIIKHETTPPPPTATDLRERWRLINTAYSIRDLKSVELQKIYTRMVRAFDLFQKREEEFELMVVKYPTSAVRLYGTGSIRCFVYNRRLEWPTYLDMGEWLKSGKAQYTEDERRELKRIYNLVRAYYEL